MFNWFDLMRQAQTSAALASLAQQFNLSGDQTQRTMAAFMPAFAMGLQQATVSNDPARLFQTMMSGAYQNFWQAAGHSFSSQAQQEGRRLLDQLFGSDEVSRRVAHQAADYAGISTETMQQLLPVLAGILAGGMSHWMTAQAHALQSFGSSEEGAKDKAETCQSLGGIVGRMDDRIRAGEEARQSVRGHDGERARGDGSAKAAAEGSAALTVLGPDARTGTRDADAVSRVPSIDLHRGLEGERHEVLSAAKRSA